MFTQITFLFLIKSDDQTRDFDIPYDDGELILKALRSAYKELR